MDCVKSFEKKTFLIFLQSFFLKLFILSEVLNARLICPQNMVLIPNHNFHHLKTSHQLSHLTARRHIFNNKQKPCKTTKKNE